MDTAALTAISPLDGRYHEKTAAYSPIFSEYGLMKFRVTVEIRWLLMLIDHVVLSGISPLSPRAARVLEDIIDHFSLQDALHIKHIESGINHDVKAIEYFIKERMADNEELKPLSEYIHFGCTSEDINNLSYALILQTARQQSILPALDDLIALLHRLAQAFATLPMLARTHGQPATPTTVGKEFANVIARIQRQREQLANVPILGKINGASGNYNALVIAFPDIDWQGLSQRFVTSLGLTWNPYTTQIEPHDAMSEFFATIQRLNTILIDLNRDVWGYISFNYFKLKSLANEVGSSTMPHKINPIDFENAEGNLGLANALLEHMINKLPVSRFQRDLSDSTVLRNIGVALTYGLLAYQSTYKGLEKIEPNKEVITKDLDQHWEILA